MTRIETAEQAEVWLATYKAGLRARAKVPSAIEVADAAVEAWRERTGTAEGPREEADLLRTQRDAARKQLEDVRVALKAFQRPDASLAQAAEHLVNAHGILRDETDAIFEALPPGEGTLVERVKRVMADLRSKLAAVNDMHDNAASAQDRLIAELSAKTDYLRSLEASAAACHQDLAAVRVALGAHNNPERSVAECVGEMAEADKKARGESGEGEEKP